MADIVIIDQNTDQILVSSRRVVGVPRVAEWVEFEDGKYFLVVLVAYPRDVESGILVYVDGSGWRSLGNNFVERCIKYKGDSYEDRD